MGLDITHYKATAESIGITDPFTADFILESEFEGFDTDIQYFEKYIRLIDTPDILRTVIFPKKETEIEKVKEFLNRDNYIFLFEKNQSDISKCLEHYTHKNKLSDNLLHRWETDKWIGFHLYNIVKKTGFYFEKVGYQRKGVNQKIWKRFTSDNITCFTQKQDFEFTLSCVDYYWHSDTKQDVQLRKKLFEENFVDKYEKNKSWMSLSY